MDTDQVIWIVVAVVVILAIAALAWMLSRRAQHKKTVERTKQASALRAEADQRAQSLPDAQMRAQEERLKAEKLQLEAERAQHRAKDAETGYLQEAAAHEDRLRQADEIDPEVDGTHRSDRSNHANGTDRTDQPNRTDRT